MNNGPRLAHLPTPLEPADRLGARLGLAAGRMWVKRDDCTGLAMGGNKARKLELLVADALALGADTLVSAGGLQSNHARMTAAAASRAGLRCVLAFNATPPDRLEANQVLDVLLGSERRFLGPIAMDELNATLERIADELRRDGRRPYVIPIGGSSPLGASAYVAAADEILVDLGHEDVLVVTATGSGGTHAGLAARLGNERVMGVDVGAIVDPASTVRMLAVEVAALVGLPRPSGEPWLVRDQVGERYGAPTGACRDALLLAARLEGLLLDPVYSGKALAGLVALPPGSVPHRAIVFLATGGAPALFTSRYEAWLAGDADAASA
jgi:1-aminocyclopropane-1-carboxylate deaminase/D-cysteine desulfhydrase-like pyridoxal-dependent ACC family enzyme